MGYSDRLLFAAHLRAIERFGAKAGNLAWVWTDSAVLSKTNKGLIETTRLAKYRYSHTLNAS